MLWNCQNIFVSENVQAFLVSNL